MVKKLNAVATDTNELLPLASVRNHRLKRKIVYVFTLPYIILLTCTNITQCILNICANVKKANNSFMIHI